LLALDEPVRALFWLTAAALKQLTANRQEAVSRYPGCDPRKRYLCEIGMKEAGAHPPIGGCSFHLIADTKKTQSTDEKVCAGD
jgi:hypothetical protein